MARLNNAELSPDQNETTPDRGQWVPIWTAATQLTEPDNLPPLPFRDEQCIFRDSTIRQTLRLTARAQRLRCHISNAFGLTSLRVAAVTAAIAARDPSLHTVCGSRKIQVQSKRTLSFNGDRSATISPDSYAVSDLFELSIEAGEILSISIYLQNGQEGGAITSHPGSRTDSWLSTGDCTSDETIGDSSQVTTNVKHWYFLSAIEAWKDSKFEAFAIIGDSISDGRISTDNANNRWPDLLFDRIQSDEWLRDKLAIVNQSLGGNRVLQDGIGPSLQSRFERDILSLSNLRGMLLFAGVNDIGTAAPAEVESTADDLISAYQQICDMARARGLAIFVATIPPFQGPSDLGLAYPHPLRVKAWRRVNDWIRRCGEFDVVIDVAKIIQDPDNADQIAEKFSSGDYLHPNVEGFHAIANSFPLDKLTATMK